MIRSGKPTRKSHSKCKQHRAAHNIDNPAEHAVRYRTVRSGEGATVFTVGYERRDGAELIELLLDAGIDVLVDVRQKALSRKPDFRGKALAARCDDAGVKYERIPQLGSTVKLRDELRSSGDFQAFRRKFRVLARKSMQQPMQMLGQLAQQHSIALLCYERLHEECHRSILTEFLGDQIDANIVAIV